jgi:UDP-2,3-diacylglucosamine hydrolase
MTSRTKTYFLSDAHLGAKYIANRRAHEDVLVGMLDAMLADAKTVYLLGDILDFWFEYRTVVPRGFVRFFAAVARLTDAGVKVYWFKGNHDMWIFDYLRDELGVEIVDDYVIHTIDGKKFLLSHGDGLGNIPTGFKYLRRIFRNGVCQKLCAAIHPRWILPFAHSWSSHSRGDEKDYVAEYLGDDKENSMQFAREYAAVHKDIDYFVVGHRHIAVDRPIVGSQARLIILGDCFAQFNYAVFDGQELVLKQFDTKNHRINKV